jgi:hypothetical protein
MAALSSTQSGNWTSATTWGNVTPADGDTFTINYGHKVTVNSNTVVTQGYGDVAGLRLFAFCHKYLYTL